MTTVYIARRSSGSIINVFDTEQAAVAQARLVDYAGGVTAHTVRSTPVGLNTPQVPAAHVLRAIIEQAQRQLHRAEDFSEDDVAGFACVLSDLTDLDQYLVEY